MIDVSIIIVNYNAPEMLDACLGSIGAYAEGFTYECIVVDNHSTKGDIASIVAKHPHTKFIGNAENRGFSAANNQGIACAQGEYLLILNNDTLFLENSLLKMIGFSRTLDGDFFIGCKLLNADGSRQASFFDFPTVANIFSSNYFLYLFLRTSRPFNKYHAFNAGAGGTIETDVVIGACIFCKASTMRRLGGFDERMFFYCEEIDLAYRLKQAGGRVYYYPETAIVHYGGATAGVHWFKVSNQSVAIVQFFQKHFHGIRFAAAVTIHYSGLLLRACIYAAMGAAVWKRSVWMNAWYHLRAFTIYPHNRFKSR